MMKLWMKYLSQYRLNWMLLGAFVLIFAVVFSLYRLELEAVGYAFFLCLFLLLVVETIHFFRFRKQQKERMRLLQNILLVTEELPAPKSPLEEDYQKMVLALRNEYQKNETKFQQERIECMDYYTTWMHQIKTPISVMQMILKSEDTEEHRALLAELFRIEQYVEMVLCYLRLDSSASDFVFQSCCLDAIIRGAIRKYAPQFIRKKIRLYYDGTDQVVLTDEKWLAFVIEQLLSNAVKYTEQGSVTISVTPKQVSQITDTGIGIDAADLPRIFEKGFTGYNGRANRKSTGLGLYLCKKIMDRLSNRIFAESEVGVGSTFSLDLHRESEKI